MLTRVAVGLIALGAVSPIHAQPASGPARDAAVLREVVLSLRQEFPREKVMQLNARRYGRRLGPDGQLVALQRTDDEMKHDKATIDLLTASTGLASVASLDDAPKNCAPDRRRPPPAEICLFRDAAVIVTLGEPTYDGDAAVVLVHFIQNSKIEGLGTVSRLFKFTAVRDGMAWKIVDRQPVGSIG